MTETFDQRSITGADRCRIERVVIGVMLNWIEEVRANLNAVRE